MFSIFGIGNVCYLKSFFLTYLLFVGICTHAQSLFEQRITFIDSLSAIDSREKIFIHHDKPLYQLKDTFWLKGYIVTAAEHLPNDSSRLAHVEIIDAEKKVVKRISPACYWGLFNSYIVLDDGVFSQGEYLLRAYTQRMRNFGDSLFFSSRFAIADPAASGWQINLESLYLNNNRLSLSIILPKADHRSKPDPLVVRLLSGNKTVLRWNGTPDSFGKLHLDTALNTTDNLSMDVEISRKDGLKWRLPVPDQFGKPDLQFMPEGGSFIIGKDQRLAFKALNPLGKPIEVKGVVKDNTNAIITSFTSEHEGMGLMLFQPQAGKTYTAYLDNGYEYPLPNAANSGYTLRTDAHSDSLLLSIDATEDHNGKMFYFTAATRGVIQTWGRSRKKEGVVHVSLDKKQFPSGVSVITLYNEQLLPVNERAFFVWHNDTLQLTADGHKPAYQFRDSVHLSVSVKDDAGNPVSGSFSIAVIDTSQVIVNKLKENLLSYMLLSADLKGTVENPYQYCNDSAAGMTDLLMLTQGWVSYQQPFANKHFNYEKDFTISGRVSNVFNKPLANSSITLFGRVGKSGMFLMDTTTSERGQFVFNNFPVFDTDSVSMVIKALNKRGKAFNVGIDLDEPDYPPYSGKIPLTSTVGVLMDSAVKTYTRHQRELINSFKRDGIYLEEVVVTGRVKIAGSKNLNADGGADQLINESTLETTPKETLVDVLHQQVKGFRVGSPPKSARQQYMVNSNIARFVIDGIDLEFFYQQENETTNLDYLTFYKGILSYFSAEDIKAIEIMNTPRYNSIYRNRFLSVAELMNSGPATVDYSFIEITTHSGSGPFMRKTPGIYLLKPVYPFIARQFYSPRYTSTNDRPVFPDYRTTVYWDANLIADSAGKAQTWFYTSESKGNYLMLIQGTDLKGRFGVLYKPLYILPEESEQDKGLRLNKSLPD